MSRLMLVKTEWPDLNALLAVRDRIAAIRAVESAASTMTRQRNPRLMHVLAVDVHGAQIWRTGDIWGRGYKTHPARRLAADLRRKFYIECEYTDAEKDMIRRGTP